MEGYGLYWYCLELIAGTVEKHNLTFELEHDSEVIAFDTGIHAERVQEMMSDMVSLGLFENDRGVITCLKMATRTDEYTQKLIKTERIKTLSRQCPDNLPIKSELIEENRIEENRIDNIYSTSQSDVCDDSEEPVTKNKVPFSRIVDLYHKLLPELPRIEQLSDKRKSYIRQRWEKNLPDLINWENFFDYIRQSDFLMGKVEPKDDRKLFRPNLEWLTKQGNYINILEGKYH